MNKEHALKVTKGAEEEQKGEKYSALELELDFMEFYHSEAKYHY